MQEWTSGYGRCLELVLKTEYGPYYYYFAQYPSLRFPKACMVASVSTRFERGRMVYSLYGASNKFFWCFRHNGSVVLPGCQHAQQRKWLPWFVMCPDVMAWILISLSTIRSRVGVQFLLILCPIIAASGFDLPPRCTWGTYWPTEAQFWEM